MKRLFSRRLRQDEGFMMAALLVAMAVMMVAMTAALPAWQTAARREKEAELIFRGKQYARALSAFQRKYANSYPPNVDVLINERFLRKKYKDPITNDDFAFVGPGSALPTTTTSPFGAGSTTPGGLSGSSTLQTGARGGTSTLSNQTSQIGRGMTLGTTTNNAQNTQASRPGVNVGGGTTTGIQAVYSKSKEKSLRVYNGYDHYNEWVFVATAATTTVTSPTGGQTPGQGTRGGAAGTRGGQPTGRGGQGIGQGRGGLQPPPGGGAPQGGRGGGPGGQGGPGGGANPFGGAGGFGGRGR